MSTRSRQQRAREVHAGTCKRGQGWVNGQHRDGQAAADQPSAEISAATARSASW